MPSTAKSHDSDALNASPPSVVEASPLQPCVLQSADNRIRDTLNIPILRSPSDWQNDRRAPVRQGRGCGTLPRRLRPSHQSHKRRTPRLTLPFLARRPWTWGRVRGPPTADRAPPPRHAMAPGLGRGSLATSAKSSACHVRFCACPHCARGRRDSDSAFNPARRRGRVADDHFFPALIQCFAVRSPREGLPRLTFQPPPSVTASSPRHRHDDRVDDASLRPEPFRNAAAAMGMARWRRRAAPAHAFSAPPAFAISSHAAATPAARRLRSGGGFPTTSLRRPAPALTARSSARRPATSTFCTLT